MDQLEWHSDAGSDQRIYVDALDLPKGVEWAYSGAIFWGRRPIKGLRRKQVAFLTEFVLNTPPNTDGRLKVRTDKKYFYVGVEVD